ncbi:MAG: hypothetical protein GDA48_24870 [Hormoscilla sp. GM102CHS1]|nr:hypothetical protein [Hormoscilla sp. GM102CHS1]MBC6481589.1 hypothetical protein [Hormoscilla sp. GM7CHS1pb]MBC6473870.1 hypothetical protein [Hormoscilla sp. GM102CHS1]MBC6474112.1 hypothetical protein [Hormoscilla sp. GM102CHS1]MBC6474219.1 hypothetical protein [Hormoscilla sp. GM102CHS1]
MEALITTIFVLGDELLKALNIKEDPQVKMNNAEVMTVGLVAAYFFGGHASLRALLSIYGGTQLSKKSVK